MRKRSLVSILHQFFKELKIAKRKGKSVLIPFTYLSTYIIQNRVKRDRFELSSPWMTVPAVKFLEKKVKKEFRVFEYGSGASTFYFLNKNCELHTVEHNREWFNKMSNKLEDRVPFYNNLRLLEPVRRTNSNGIFSSKDPAYLECDYYLYCNGICKFKDGFFDLVVIDGRARVECLKLALTKIRPGGYLLFDNADREEYGDELIKLKDFLVLSDFTVTNFDLSFSQTNIYRLP
ncbi:hypothetical protein ACFPIK_00840 [Algoriphagus aquatilis]|uniref:Class I SAM-dependent methyltransferase n=1 Tax=Algoriphagus aquatilis TaxID=490186 RepID=A0ABW0BS18_9BACT